MFLKDSQTSILDRDESMDEVASDLVLGDQEASLPEIPKVVVIIVDAN